MEQTEPSLQRGSTPLTTNDPGPGLFVLARQLVNDYPRMADVALASAMLALSTLWLVWVPYLDVRTLLVQTALVVPLAWRRSNASFVFLTIAAVAFMQWVLGYRLVGDVALLVALYTVAVHSSRLRAVLAATLLEVGVVMAAVRWTPAGTVARSFVFLTATVVAALSVGLTVRSGSRYLSWLDERAARLELERDQQAVIAASAERARIAREMHDIVAHSLSVVVTLADAATTVGRADPERAAAAMGQVSEVGRQALADMRATIGVLRTDEVAGTDPTRPDGGVASGPLALEAVGGAALGPQPGLAELESLFERVRATGLEVETATEGTPFLIGPAGELTVYRIVQEAMTNAIKHSSARRVTVRLRYAAPALELEVRDDGGVGHGAPAVPAAGAAVGHGIEGMRERAKLHGGELWAGPGEDGGWEVSTTLWFGDCRVPA